VRSPRPPHVKYHIGQVVRHTRFGYRGVIIGWDAVAKVNRIIASCIPLDCPSRLCFVSLDVLPVLIHIIVVDASVTKR